MKNINKTKGMIILLLALVLILVIFASLAFSSWVGDSVTLNLAFHIGSSKSDDTLNSSTNYISSYDSGEGCVVGLIAANKEISTNYNSSYSVDDYLLQANQRADGNRFFLVFTEGDANEVSSNAANIGNGKLFSGTFYDFAKASHDYVNVFLMLKYYTIDLLADKVLGGSVDLIVENSGKENGKTKIDVDVVE